MIKLSHDKQEKLTDEYFLCSYYPCDPPYVTDELREAKSFQISLSRMKTELDKMQQELHKSVPFFSTRYKVGYLRSRRFVLFRYRAPGVL